MLLSRQWLFSRTGCATLFTLASAASVGSALGFEHIGGYIPCALCLLQRIPYYVSLPVGLVAIAASAFGTPRIFSPKPILSRTVICGNSA